MDDPRGGVRHVIPSRGNYLRQVAPLATGGEGNPFARHVLPLFDQATEACVVAAFVQESGLARVRPAVHGALARGADVRILTGDYLDITQASALELLLDWQRAYAGNDSEEDTPAGCFAARVVEVAALPGRTRSFHPKSWLFESPTFGVAFVGSSNLSRSALDTGIQWNLRVDRDRDGVPRDVRSIVASGAETTRAPTDRQERDSPNGPLAAQAIIHRTEAAVRRTTPSRRSRSLLPHTEAAPSSRPRLAPR